MNTYPSSTRLILSFAAALLLLAESSHLYAQASPAPSAAAAATDATSPSPTADAPATTKTLWRQILEGGWVMIPIGACSIATIYLIVDGTIRTGVKKIAPPEHEQRLKDFFQGGDYVGAYQFCKANPSP